MKKILIVTLAVLLAVPVLAQDTYISRSIEYGARAGATFGPDQFHFGAHADLGQVIEGTRLVPNIEIGLGDHHKTFSFAGDVLYDFAALPFSVGGELALLYTKLDLDLPSGVEGDDSVTDLGLSVLGNYRLALNNGKELTFEAKVGLVDSPDFKISVLYNLF